MPDFPDRRALVRKLAWQKNGLQPWYVRMLIWSRLRGAPYRHGAICGLRRDLRDVLRNFDA